jgi:hypothetical protein
MVIRLSKTFVSNFIQNQIPIVGTMNSPSQIIIYQALSHLGFSSKICFLIILFI